MPTHRSAESRDHAVPGGAVPHASIHTRLNWGDFKAFTTIPHERAAIISARPAKLQLTVKANDGPIELRFGGSVGRLRRYLRSARRLRSTRDRPLAFVRWLGILVVGIPTYDGFALFRACEIPMESSAPRREASGTTPGAKGTE